MRVLLTLLALATTLILAVPGMAGQLEFVENKGQLLDTEGNPVDPNIVTHYANGGDVWVFVRPDGLSYVTKRMEVNADGEKEVFLHRVDTRAVDAEEAQIRSLQPREGTSKYYHRAYNDGVTGVSSFAEIRLEGLYDDIDMVIYSNEQGLKYDFVCHPGADVADIQIEYIGASSVEALNNTIVVATTCGDIVEGVPFSYVDSKSSDVLQSIPTQYNLNDNVLSFDVELDEIRETLVIDPGVVWAGYIGGLSRDEGLKSATDGKGFIVFGGETESIVFPVSEFPLPEPFQKTYAGLKDIFIAKFDRWGVKQWATYFGGSKADDLGDLEVGRDGSIFLVGSTISTDFPVQSPFRDPNDQNNDLDSLNMGTQTGLSDAWVARFNQAGGLINSSYFGGTAGDVGNGIGVNSKGDYFVVGYTNAIGVDFPLDKPIKSSKNAPEDAFIAGFRGTGLGFSTYFGGTGYDEALDVVAGEQDNFVVVGRTQSSDFPTTFDARDKQLSGVQDMFIMEFLREPFDTTYVSYYGGDNSDFPLSVAMDSTGTVAVAGITDSDDIVTTTGAFMQDYPSASSSNTGWVTKFDSSFDTEYATYIGGDSSAQATSVAFFDDGTVAVTGSTDSPDFPTTLDAFQRDMISRPATPPDECDPCYAAHTFMVHLDNDGDTIFSSLYGGLQPVLANSIAIVPPTASSPEENMFVMGTTQETNLMVVPAGNSAHVGGEDVFMLEYGCNIDVAISTSGNTTFCRGESIELDAGEGYESYEWSSGEDTQTITVTKTGEYTVTVTNDIGCAAVSAPVSVIVHPFPEAEISTTRNTVLCSGENIELDAGPGFESYKWSDDSDQQTLVVDAAGVYSVTVSNEFGCTSTASIEVFVIDDVAFALSASEVDFGFLDGCIRSSTASIQITNENSFSFTIDESVASDAEFSLNTVLPLVVEAGETVELELNFAPSSAGDLSGNIVLTGTPCDLSIDIPLSGGSGEIEVAMTPSNAPFGNVLLCDDTPATRNVTITNNGQTQVTINEPVLADPQLSITPPSAWPVLLEPQGSETFVVELTPALVGAVSETVEFPYVSGSCDDVLSLVVTANVIDPVLDIDASFDFGDVATCGDAVVENIRVENNSTEAIRLDQVNVVAPFSSASAGLDIPAGGFATISVEALPMADGPATETATIQYTVGTCSREVTIDLNVNGYTPLLLASDSEVDFGVVLTCESTRFEELLTLTHGAPTFEPIIVEEIAVTGDFSVEGIADNDVITNSREITVVFEPTGLGVANGSLTIRTNQCDQHLVIPLSGEAQGPTLDVVTEVDFGSVANGAREERMVTVTNTGTDPIVIDDITCAITPFSFQPSTTLPATLNANEELIIVVWFDAGQGDPEGRLCLELTQPCETTREIRLIGDVATPSAEITLRVESITADVTDAEAEVQISIVDAVGIDEITVADSLKAVMDIVFEANTFFPRTSDGGANENNLIRRGDAYVMEIRNWTVPMPLRAGDWFSVYGVPLVGDATTSTVRIENVVFDPPIIDVRDIVEGTITFTGYCEEGGTRFIDASDVKPEDMIIVTPNPSDGPATLVLKPYPHSQCAVEVYGLNGAKQFELQWQQGAEEDHSVVVDQLPSGTYQVVFKTHVKQFSTTMVIKK